MIALTIFIRAEGVHALKRTASGTAVRESLHSGEIALAGSRRLRSTLAAASVLFVHAVVTVIYL